MIPWGKNDKQIGGGIPKRLEIHSPIEVGDPKTCWKTNMPNFPVGNSNFRMSCRIPFCWELSYIIQLLSLNWRPNNLWKSWNVVSLTPQLWWELPVMKEFSKGEKGLTRETFPTWKLTTLPRPRRERLWPYQRSLFSCNRANRYCRYSGFSGSVGPVEDFLDCYTFTMLYQCVAIAEQSDFLIGSNE